MTALALLALLTAGCFPVLMVGAFATGPWLWTNLPTCDLRQPIHARCREVRGVFGGTVDGRIHTGIRP